MENPNWTKNKIELQHNQDAFWKWLYSIVLHIIEKVSSHFWYMQNKCTAEITY